MLGQILHNNRRTPYEKAVIASTKPPLPRTPPPNIKWENSITPEQLRYNYLQSALKHINEILDDTYTLDKQIDVRRNDSIIIYKSSTNLTKKIIIKQGNLAIGKEAQNVLALSKCENIIKLISVYENGMPINIDIDTKLNSKAWYIICYKYVEGGDLYDFISNKKNFDTKTENEIHTLIISIFIKIIHAIVCMHDNLMFHFDLKPYNILYNDGDIIIIDLESSRRAKNDSRTHFLYNDYVASTPHYRLPIIRNKNGSVNGLHQDGYSIGIMLNMFIDAIKYYRPDIQHLDSYKTLSSSLTNDDFETYKYKDGLRPVITELCTLAKTLNVKLDKDIIEKYCNNKNNTSGAAQPAANQPGGARLHKKRKTYKRHRHQRNALTHYKKRTNYVKV